MWLHLTQTFLHVSMAAGCRRENALVWMTIDLMTLAMLWLVRSPGPLSTRGCGNKMFVFCFLVCWWWWWGTRWHEETRTLAQNSRICAMYTYIQDNRTSDISQTQYRMVLWSRPPDCSQSVCDRNKKHQEPRGVV